MNTLPKAILDTSALISLYELDLLSYLNLMYEEVLIPDAVEYEFLENPRIDEEEKTKRFNYFLENLGIHATWLKQCKDYDTALIDLYLTIENMDKGEAETLAQNQSLENLYEVIIDEKFAKKFARQENMEVHGTLYLIAVLDIRLGVCDYFEYTQKMMNETTTHISEKVINMVYEAVEKEHK